MAHIIWPIFQLVKTFKILSFNRTAFFRPRNKSVLEKVNELPGLTSWANPTNWERIIKSTNNYSDLRDEKERFQIFDFRFVKEQKPYLFTRKQVSKRFQDINEFKKIHLPCHFFVETKLDYSTYTWKWKDGQA